MTGNNDNRSLLNIFGRYKHAPWRGGYSLSRLFLSFYLLVMGSFVVIAFVADFVISSALKGITDDYTSRFMRGTIVLIEDSLFRKPQKEWPKIIKDLDAKFSYRLDIVERWTLKLPPKQAEKLDSGELAIDAEGDVIYHRLKQTPQVLKVGPISPGANPDQPRILPLDLRIRLLTWSLIGLFLAVAVWFWVRPVWRDLEALRQTARALGEGHFETRSPEARSGAFELLTETLNGMAERIQRLIATQKELSSAISHELRTPISRMRFALEMLTETDEREEQERLWQMMNVDLEELDNLIDSSLTYSRFEREQPELNLTPVDFEPWLNDEVDSLRILGRNHEITVDTTQLSEGLQVELDLKSMPYAITNLLRNALKYAKSRIVVSAEVIGNSILVHVDDDGIGIPRAAQAHIFDKFYRVPTGDIHNVKGFGLGLYYVGLIAAKHGGSVAVESTEGRGTTFTLIIPDDGR